MKIINIFILFIFALTSLSNAKVSVLEKERESISSFVEEIISGPIHDEGVVKLKAQELYAVNPLMIVFGNIKDCEKDIYVPPENDIVFKS